MARLLESKECPGDPGALPCYLEDPWAEAALCASCSQRTLGAAQNQLVDPGLDEMGLPSPNPFSGVTAGFGGLCSTDKAVCV